ncbi:MAG: CotH kinase family protein [Saprospiraceae bacterium]|nr:CotH kinase family protein [Saprospiraceae bacterium]
MNISRSILLYISVLCLHTSIGTTQSIVINEFMSDNESVISDEDGDFTDWLELYNPSSQTINLLGYHITDDKDDLKKWTFPSITIAPKEYLIVFASGKDKVSGNQLHTNFKISNDGEKLILSNSLEIVIDEISKIALEEDISYGRLPDGSSNLVPLSIPTPNTTNDIEDVLQFSHEKGFYASPFNLTIASSLNQDIFYTTNGSEPTPNDLLYTTPISLSDKSSEPNIISEIPTTPPQDLISNPAWQSPGYLVDKAHILRFASYKNGIKNSPTYSKTYLIKEDVHQKYDLPVISLLTDPENFFDPEHGIYIPGNSYDSENPEWTGNYFIDEIESERPIHITYFENDGTIGFSQDCGARIHGGKTRHASQKSLKLYARKGYGEKYFKYPLMPQNGVNKYKRFLLQTTMAAWGGETVIKDILAHDIARDLDFEKMDHQPVVVFLNGEYWGIHHIRDRIDEEYLSYTTGLDLDSLEVDRIGNTHFRALTNYFKEHLPIDDEELDYIATQMEIPAFIDYQIAEMFLKNYDWPANNSMHWRPKKSNGKWRWIFFDIDGGFNDYEYNMFEHNTNIDSTISWPNDPRSTFYFRTLIENETFANLFLDRYKSLLENEFQSSKTKEKLLKLIDQYEFEMPNHIKRWHFPSSMNTWLTDIQEDLVEFLEKRPCVVVENIKSFFDLNEFNVVCKDTSGSNVTIFEPNLLKAMPNPNNGTFYLKNENPVSFHFDYLLFNSIGQQIAIGTDIRIAENGNHTISLDNPSNGYYFLKIMNHIKSITIPISIVR